MSTTIAVPGARRQVAGALVLCALLLAAGHDAAAQGRINNAKTETRSAAQGLEREVRALASRSGITWFGYRVPMTAGPRQMCCYDTIGDAGNACCGACRLESGSGVTMSTGDAVTRSGSRIVLEPATEFLILGRLEGGVLTRVRTFTPDCDIDAGGMPLVWLNDVKPEDSVAWLSSLIPLAAGNSNRDQRDRVGKTAISALALHDTRSALTILIDTAKNGQSRDLRGQALFWLAQRAGQDALATITGAVDNDPDLDVKKKAVFALSQMPKDEGVPKLIEIARSHRNVEVRKQAMFWLGQSNDPRAVRFFEDILLKK